MRIEKYLRATGAIAVVLTAIGWSAGASATTFNTSLADPPGFYNGTGSPNVGFTVNIVNGVEFGLSTVYRGIGPVTPVNDVYSVPTGLDVLYNNNAAIWNYQYSINLIGTNPSLHLQDIIPTLSVLNVGNGQSFSFNPFISTPDNAGWGPSGENLANSNMSTDYGFQNSQNLSFIIPYLPAFGFSPYTNDTYIITLSAALINGSPLGSVSETTIVGTGAVVPLPAAMPLFATGLGAFGLFGWRKKRKGSAAIAA